MPSFVLSSLPSFALLMSYSSSPSNARRWIVCVKSWRFPSVRRYGTSSYRLCALVRNERPGERWMLPTTLFTRTRPAMLHPSCACSFSVSDQPSLTHCAREGERGGQYMFHGAPRTLPVREGGGREGAE